MKILNTAFGLSAFLVIMGGSWVMPTVASADPVKRTYIACNQYGDCWRVERRFAYGADAPVTYYKSDWYDAHQNDEHVHWRSDPVDDRGYYMRDGSWHEDPGARALTGGVTGAGIGAAIGCIVTIPIGCLPGAAVGAAVGGGTGAVVGVATTPDN